MTSMNSHRVVSNKSTSSPAVGKSLGRLAVVACAWAAVSLALAGAAYPPRPVLAPGQSNWVPTIGPRALTATSLADGLTPQDLVNALIGPGVTVSNVTYSGATIAAGTFAGGTGIVGFDHGLILSSGNIASIAGPNTQDGTTTNNGLGGDADLTNLIPGYETYDATTLEFDFQCEDLQLIQFQYVFTSEEYNEYVDSAFNDVFGFFLNGVNIALLPDQVAPVAINNVNCGDPYAPPGGANCNLFINNDCSDIPPGLFPCAGNRDTEMDGLTVVFTATAAVNPGVNHIKLAIADAGDLLLDSNVFIKGESFVCEPPRGACCDRATNTCRNDILADDCAGTSMQWSVGLRCEDLDPPCAEVGPPPRGDATKKGTVLVFPKVELRFNAAGELIQDTFISLTNDMDNEVQVQMYFVSETCTAVDNGITLSQNQPAYWSAATGLPGPNGGVSPFTMLAAPYPDPAGSGDFVVRGFVVAWAVNADRAQVRWNHLAGEATIVNYARSDAWEYTAYAFQALTGANGQTFGTPGTIRLDGAECELTFDTLVLDFFASGSQAFSGGAKNVLHDTDLTLLIADLDFRQEAPGPYTTKAVFEIWNENEISFSGQEYCVTKWDQSLLSQQGGHFLLNNLQTNKGKARIHGVQSVLCPGSTRRPLLGVAAKLLTFDGVCQATAGTTLVGSGTETMSIQYDIPAGPQEKVKKQPPATPVARRYVLP